MAVPGLCPKIIAARVLNRQLSTFAFCKFCAAEDEDKEEPRMLGLAMVPGRHIVSICVDENCIS
jgi:hypothetical protein